MGSTSVLAPAPGEHRCGHPPVWFADQKSPPTQSRWGGDSGHQREIERDRSLIPTAESPDSQRRDKTLSYQRHARPVKSRDFRPLVLHGKEPVSGLIPDRKRVG